VREAFVKALEANEDDAVTRAVYADWLEERGEHEEADRQRKWPAAKAWLVEFAKKNGSHCTNYDELDDDDVGNFEETTYQQIIAYTAAYVDSHGEEHFVQRGSEMLRDALYEEDACRQFWESWSIVTGRPVATKDIARYGGKPNPFCCSC